MTIGNQEHLVNARIDRWMKRLLDFSGRNRLLIYKPAKSTTLEIVSPAGRDLFDRLVVKGQTLAFPQADQAQLPDSLEQPETSDAPVEVASKETPLVVRCQPRQLARILYNLHLRSRSAREEQGINILYLAFGFLNWRDAQRGEMVRSPLLLVPVELSREAVGRPYRLAMLEDDLVINPTLQEAMRQFYNLQLPAVDNDLDAVGLARLLDEAQACVAGQPGWQVDGAVALDVFTYQKQMIVADLKEHGAQLRQNPLVRALSVPGYPLPQGPGQPVAAHELDDKVTPEMTFQVLDADSSQQEAVQAAKSGISFVLQGPPGTGKSQTITNIIAEFLAQGKKVLFVSAKMAALEVVQDRLSKAGLGDFCLQVHSHRRNKREVIEELRQSLESPAEVTPVAVQARLQNLQKVRGQLNGYVRALHRPHFAQRLTAYRLYGLLDALGGAPEMQFVLPAAQVSGAAFEEQRLQIGRMVTFTGVIQSYERHPWYGCTLGEASLQKRSELQGLLAGLAADIGALQGLAQQLGQLYHLPEAPRTMNGLAAFMRFAGDYLPAILQAPVGEMLQRYQKQYSAITRYARPQYWRDRQQIAALARSGKVPETSRLLADLAVAHRLQRQARHQPGLAPVGLPTAAGSDPSAALFAHSQDLMRQVQHKLDQLSACFDLHQRPAGLQNLPEQNLASIAGTCQHLLANLGLLHEWVAFQGHAREAARLGIGPFVTEALNRRLPPESWASAFERRFYLLYLDEVLNHEPQLAQFTGEAHQQTIKTFRQLDREMIHNARLRIRESVLAARPQASWMSAPSSEEAILRREINKKRRIKPLRVLFSEIPGLILRLRPCLMMSPLTVSQLLDPGKYAFDLVVFDEASQIRPEEAVGAVVRGRQVIVVGDRHQLPPTNFFETLEMDEESDEETFEEDLESVLNEFDAAGLPNKMLAWHYRSKDESLIAFSNHHFYGDRLMTFPSAHPNRDGAGLAFVHVPEGVYQRGGRRNPVEAARVVEMILDHYRATPERTLGVVTFSQAQRDTIQLALDQALQQAPELQPFFSESADESFFVKNLELVQGDERDVMIFSIGYARDENGKFVLNFGPLNKTGGERRLNVAITRARYAVKLAASFQPEEIDLSRTSSRGVQLLRSYMILARGGISALYGDLRLAPNADFDSPFEQQVYERLSAHGLALNKQVGVSSYRIDLAVLDPEQPGHHLLGIECDGSAYHRAQTARDRDRLRQEVLERLGWRIHRIWSRDWFEDPARETAKVLQALEAAKNGGNPEPEKKSLTPPPDGTQPLAARAQTYPAQPEIQPRLPQGAVYYTTAKLPMRFRGADALNSAYAYQIEQLVQGVIDAEGPAHLDLVKTRIAQACGIARVGARVDASIRAAVDGGSRAGRFALRGPFLWALPLALPPVRVPPDGADRRSIEQIPPEEIALALDLCLRHGLSLTLDDLVRETARLFKLRAVDANAEIIQAVARLMAQHGLIALRGEKYTPVERAPGDPLPLLQIF